MTVKHTVFWTYVAVICGFNIDKRRILLDTVNLKWMDSKKKKHADTNQV